MTRRVDDRQMRIHFPSAASERHAIHAARQIDIGEQNIDGRRSEMRERITRIAHRAYGKTLIRQILSNHFPDQEFILDEL